jgi:hypothetical protein
LATNLKVVAVGPFVGLTVSTAVPVELEAESPMVVVVSPDADASAVVPVSPAPVVDVVGDLPPPPHAVTPTQTHDTARTDTILR